MKSNRQQQTIRYLNTDLDIKSAASFNNLVAYFRKMKMSENIYKKINSKVWLGSFEIGLQESHPEQTIGKFIKILKKLGKDELKEWNNCKSKIFNIGFDCGKVPRSFNNLSCCLSAELLNEVAKIGAGIEITIYPEPKSVKK